MAIYRYQHPLIDHIETSVSRHDATKATIFMTPNADAAMLADLRKKLGEHSIDTLMDSKNGQAVLQVRGLRKDERLITTLEKIGIRQDGPVTKTPDEEQKRKGSLGERIRGKSLFLSALFYDLGNVALIVSGIQRGKHNPGGKMLPHDKSELMTGVAFSIGDVAMTLYGDDREDRELSAAENSLKRHLHKKGIKVPEDDVLNPDTLHQSGVFKATDRWMRRHIIHVKCLTETTAGLYMIHAGMKRDAKNQLNRGKLTAGFLLTAGWLATFLLDKSHKPANLEVGNGEKDVLDHITENPRGWIARPFSMGNNVANLWGALNPRDGERKRFHEDLIKAEEQFKFHASEDNQQHLTRARAKQHDYMWNVMTASSFMVANMLFGMSGSKRPRETEDDKALMQDIVLLSANMLAQQPEKIRQAAIGEAAQYIADLPHIGLNAVQAAQVIQDKIDSLNHSTWAVRVKSKDNAAIGAAI